MKSAVLLVFLISISPAICVGETYEQDTDGIESDFCNRSVVKMEVEKDIFHTGHYAQILYSMLSGDTKSAGESLGA